MSLDQFESHEDRSSLLYFMPRAISPTLQLSMEAHRLEGEKHMWKCVQYLPKTS